MEHDIQQLIQEIKRLGSQNDKGQYTVKFGVLVMDDRINNLFEALVAVLKAAKKRKAIDYSGEILLQGPSNQVDIIVL